MATLLYRLGRISFLHPWRVVAAWILVLGILLGGGLALGGKTQESFSIPGTESQEAIDRLAAVFPQAAGASAQIVTEAPAGEKVTDDGPKAAIEATATAAGEVQGVATALSPFSEYATDAVSDDGTVAITTVQFSGQSDQVTTATLDALKESAQAAEDAGLTVSFGGQVFQDVHYGVTVTEAFGVLFAGLVLVLTFGSMLAAGLPLIGALVGVAASAGALMAASRFVTVSSASPLLAVMIGLAVGIDYALFILMRHRTQLANGMPVERSAATAVATAGSAVIFAGVTVIIALLGLLVVQIPFLTVMGLGAAFAVLLAMGVATTLLPAMLGFAGERLRPQEGSRAARRAKAQAEGTQRTLGARWVKIVTKVPIIPVVIVVGIAGLLAVPASQLQLGLPSGATEPAGSTSRVAYDTVSDAFGPGHNGPLVVLVDITQTTDPIGVLGKIGDEIRGLDDVAFVGTGTPNPSVDTAIIQVVPDSPPESAETTALMQSIRDLAPGLHDRYDTRVSVTGTTAVQNDISQRLDQALVPFGIVVVGLSILLLMIVFRSIFVPVKAAIGFLLSVVVSFGTVVLIFQQGLFADALGVTPGPILSFMPILLMAILFGLAMDYEVFLVSGMREDFVHHGDAKRAIVTGFSGAARVVTAAALIMFFVFAAFVPEGAGVIKTIALGLAVGIFFDAFLVRMTLVPAAMALLGKRAWWIPRWLDRILPDVDIEGEGLREHQDDVDWAHASGVAVAAERLVVGVPGRRLRPVDLSAPAGSLVLVEGAVADRRLLGATLGARLAPLSGRAHVAGHPLASEAGRVLTSVAMADLGRVDRVDSGVTVGDLLAERIDLSEPMGRRLGARARQAEWLGRIDQAADAAGARRIGADDPVGSLLPLERAIALTAVAAAGRAPVLVLDVVDPFPDAAAERAFLAALPALVHESTTVLLGAPWFPDEHGIPGRPTLRLRLSADDAPAPAPDAVERPDIDQPVTTGKETRR
ncbi:MMPL family transporter [Clavibacter michiganensis]|uniref:MMPL family transporter n=1 Tax=Clavibacter michiganensis TaxID=28447 RepID=UPI0026DCAF13|nr:MMPL family transporter [Clavibacter michiganensis]MDO4026994.1 MMPL family transporter [Clavibacter michiganensis]MDO4036334.1 MMPL family transporter [Clavibacter michiganensis]MDO4048505.1 MMPL family transporter [Clavibacter michiganensis]MDO4104916.1 MMPL family transporter [Clavibacter michiganensis]MDO4133757.1 MMPL family transporter [Clavibacter michiganensis]